MWIRSFLYSVMCLYFLQCNAFHHVKLGGKLISTKPRIPFEYPTGLCVNRVSKEGTLTSSRLHAIKGPARYSSNHWLECILTIPTSRVLMRTGMQIVIFTAWSAFLTWLHMTGRRKLAIGGMVHSTLGSALSLLLVFRTNSGCDR